MLPDFETLVKEIRSKRKGLSWSQKGLANRAGVSQSLVAKLEQKMNVPNYKSVRKIYETLEKTMSAESETVGDLANPDIVSAKPEDTRGEVAEVMKENDFSQLPVKKGEDFIGVVLSRDIGLARNDALVEELMRPTNSIIPESTPREAVAELLKSQNAVLVKGEREIQGIITPADLL
ncbi:hypothetical protein AKJ64_03470 [candidate division MSBL1 archaeon SCGC-AAA259E17]|uniref:HTH cro/C1-type domain-containing protein n=1 Tax=candidate division MSBL1 archaeon SCGC-AAA259E17 TaxID=1698263 RepID=A0A133UDP2_9EURY|nr:hypothetical protein AKJ64_03470 [candidate division MSBL1 archaeon SCGC-AAA259E17]